MNRPILILNSGYRHLDGRMVHSALGNPLLFDTVLTGDDAYRHAGAQYADILWMADDGVDAFVKQFMRSRIRGN